MIQRARQLVVSNGKLLAVAAAAYLAVTAVTSGGGSTGGSGWLPAVQLPSIDPAGWLAALGPPGLLLVVVGVYAAATRRGWRADLRFALQVAAIALIGYIVGRWLGPTVWGALP